MKRRLSNNKRLKTALPDTKIRANCVWESSFFTRVETSVKGNLRRRKEIRQIENRFIKYWCSDERYIDYLHKALDIYRVSIYYKYI